MNYFCSMKLLSIVLSLYILALSYDTCNDFVSFNPPYASVISMNHSGTNTVECTCSPFCHCGCCGKPMIPALALTVDQPFSLFTFAIIIDNEESLKVTLPHVWRPPVLFT